MQGKKDYQEKLFMSFRLSDHVPLTNFYRRLKSVLDLHFLYELTSPYYGKSGQKSIDPVVFFKLSLVGYLENIVSDRDLIRRSAMRMDILYFLGYNIDDSLPCHSTISRTRALYGDSVFEQVFSRILQMCVAMGMVSGHTQVSDSAPVKANASMGSLELKIPAHDLACHLDLVIGENDMGERQVVIGPQDSEAFCVGSDDDSDVINPGPGQESNTKGKSSDKIKVSNKTHYSPNDPDARMSYKPGKATRLNYNANICTDTAHHIITDAKAYHADKKDGQNLKDIVDRTQNRLDSLGLLWKDFFADGNYGSGENYAFLESRGLNGFIPPNRTAYKGSHKNFIYVEEKDHWICPKGKIIPFVKITKKANSKQRLYRGSTKLCQGCPVKVSCMGKARQKCIRISYYRAEYERVIARIKNTGVSKVKAIRQSTVEPVLGTLKEQMGLRQINSIGIEKANKCIQMAATAYNLKKYLNFIGKTPISMAGVVNHQAKKGLESAFLALKWSLWGQISCFRPKYEAIMLEIRQFHDAGFWVDKRKNQKNFC